ncbi:arginase-1 [Anabrus simplex]|uniref:arginase-1 n=1 Tax=Anabrus simplex TaxID=316456 RepID=UPI0035A2F22B
MFFMKKTLLTLARSCQVLNRTTSNVNVRNMTKQAIGIIGVPFEKGQRLEGVQYGPNALRQHGLIQELKKSYCDVIDYGDIQYEAMKFEDEVKNMHYFDHVAACSREVSEKVQHVMKQGQTALIVGGDHSVAIGSIDGHIKAKKDVSVIWVDAHADLNTAETSPSGNVHGMPMALLCKELTEFWPDLPGMDWQWPEVSVKNMAYIGLRDIDDHERLIIEKYRIAAYGMEEVQRLGVSEVIQLALKRTDPRGKRSIHLSFDIDALDYIEAPSTGTPVRGGLLLREGIQIVEECFRTGRLAGMDIVEFNPVLGTERDVKTTAIACVMLCKAVTGYSRSGKVPHTPEEIPRPGTTTNQKPNEN